MYVKLTKLHSTHDNVSDNIVGWLKAEPVKGEPLTIYYEKYPEQTDTLITTPVKEVIQINKDYSVYTQNSEYLIEVVNVSDYKS